MSVYHVEHLMVNLVVQSLLLNGLVQASDALRGVGRKRCGEL